MIIINGYDVQRFSEYKVECNTVVDGSLSFTTADGTTHKCVLGSKYKISLSTKMVDTETASAILSAISPDTFNIQFVNAAGTTLTKTFRCENKPFDLTNRFDDTFKFWQVSLTFEEV